MPEPPAIPELGLVQRIVSAVFPEHVAGYDATGDLESIAVAHYSIDRELDVDGRPAAEWIVNRTVQTWGSSVEPPGQDLVEVARFDDVRLAAVRVVECLVSDRLECVLEQIFIDSMIAANPCGTGGENPDPGPT